ncbi:MAG: tetratricopeptide repeat protein [Bacteroidales bacterium]|nr:tetratricopeptide repeat protein [Bacteroidales bacterium]
MLLKVIKYILLTFIFLQVLPIRALPQLESLEKQLEKSEGDEKFEVLLNLSKQYWFIDPAKSIDYAKEAYAYGETVNNDIKKVRALNRIGNGFYFLEEYRIALDYYNKSLDLSENTDYLTGIATASNNIGLIYNVLGDYDKALEYYYKSLEIEQKSDDRQGIANTSVNLGNIYYYLGNYQKARNFYNKALNIYQQIEDKKGMFDSYNNLGSTLSEVKKLDSAEYFYQKALKLSYELNDPDLKTSALNNLGTVFFNSKDYESALQYYNESLTLARSIDDQWSEANTLRNIGGVYMQLNKQKAAFDNLSKAMDIAQKIAATRLVMDLYNDLSEYYKSIKNYKKALECEEIYSRLNDSIFSEETSRKITNLEAKYIFKSKDQQLELVTKENEVKNLRIKTQQYIIYVVASIGLMILTLVFIFYYRSHINKKARVLLEDKNVRITEQKILLEKSIDELKDSEAKYKSLVDSIQDGLFILQQEKIIYANEAMCKILGYNNHSELYELSPRQLIAREDYQQITSNYNKRITGGSVPSSYEFKMIHKSGKEIDINLCAELTRFHGKPAIIGTIKDITRQKQYEHQLIQEKVKAEQATESKSMFLAGMSHEIRNHMNSIIGITEVLSESDLNEEQLEYINVIRTSGNNLLNIINEILDFSKIEARQVILESEEFNFHEAIGRVISLHEPLAKKAGLYLKSTTDQKIPAKLVGDQTRLSQVLINLISNALKFTTKGGIEVVSELLTVNESQGDYEIRIQVRDSGIGINEESRDKLFKAFSQTHSAVLMEKGGSGLGLAICKQLVELMGGEIGVESEVEKGSTFWFTLQLSKHKKKEKVLKSKPLQKQPVNNKNINILLVEDNMLNQQLTTNILLKEGYNVQVADNGQEGFDLYKKFDFDVVLMDIQMPVMDGIRATRLIRQFEASRRGKKATIIAVTAHAKEGEEQRLFEAGMDLYLNKPFKPSNLLALIDNLS